VACTDKASCEDSSLVRKRSCARGVSWLQVSAFLFLSFSLPLKCNMSSFRAIFILLVVIRQVCSEYVNARPSQVHGTLDRIVSMRLRANDFIVIGS
jgi:hypothetical protein